MQLMKKRNFRNQFTALLLMFSLVFGVFTATVTAEITPLPLLALGDSISTGYGLAHYTPSNLTKAKESYINRLGISMNITPVNLAKDGTTSGQLLELIQQESVMEQLSNATVITLSIGGNNVLHPMLSAIKEEFGLLSSDEVDLLTDKINEVGIMAAIPLAQAALAKAQPEIAEGVTAFTSDFPLIVEHLRNSAPNARIIISTLYNPYGGVSIAGIDLNAASEKPISDISTVIRNTLLEPAFEGSYEIVDVAEAFGDIPMNNNYVNVNFTPMNLDPHPAAPGHQVIFNLYAKLLVKGFVSFNFTDISNHKAEDSIFYLAGLGVIGGIGNDLFAPDANLTRCQFVKILFGAADGVNYNTVPTRTFSDVKSDIWYAPYVKWAVENGVTNGNTKGEFSPNGNITRQDVAVMIYRYLKTSGYSMPEVSTTQLFADDALIKDYAREAVYTLKALGFLEEKTGEKFNPLVESTRGETTMILANYAKMVRQ